MRPDHLQSTDISPNGHRSVLDVRSATKTFGTATVLRDVHLAIDAGEVHALVGQNGSGKSTLIKILAGFHVPDPGIELRLRGQLVDVPVSPDVLHTYGIAFMHQDSSLDPEMSVLENYRVTSLRYRRKLAVCNWRTWQRELRAELLRFGVDVDVNAPVGALAESDRAIVSLQRALSLLGDEGGVLVLDEPTAALDADGVRKLFNAIRTVKRQHAGVLIVTHDLDEVIEIADTVTVLRDGMVVDAGRVSDFDHKRLVASIVGREIDALYPPPGTHVPGDAVVVAESLTGETATDVSFSLRSGEILGVTGIAGMGHEELPDLVYGSKHRVAGTVRTAEGARIRGPRDAIRAGIVLVPEDRHGRSCEVQSSVRDNVVLPALGAFYRRGVLSDRRQAAAASEAIESLDVRPPDVTRLMGELSGGNQQKAVLARWLGVFPDARVLLLHEPTHGVDVGARHDIFQVVRDAADDGAAVMLVSNEYEDLAQLCDRVLVMRQGRIAAELRGPGIDDGELAAIAMSGQR